MYQHLVARTEIRLYYNIGNSTAYMKSKITYCLPGAKNLTNLVDSYC